MFTPESCAAVALYILETHRGLEVCYRSSLLYDVSDYVRTENLTLYIVTLSIHIKVTFHSTFKSLTVISFESSNSNVAIYEG